MAVSVGKSSLIPSRCRRSSMLALLAVASISSVRLSNGACRIVGMNISLLALRVACLHRVSVILSSVFSRLCLLWSVASR